MSSITELLKKGDLSKFEKGDELGRGLYGTTYLIKLKAKSMNKKYVAKVSNHTIDSIEDQIAFFKELDLETKPKSPEILQLHGISMKNFEDENYPTLIYEYYGNKLFDDEFDELEKADKYIILLAMAHGIQHLHSLSILHLNLKPSNIFLDPQNYVRISDYCQSRIDHMHNYIEDNKESYGYIPLELVNGEKGSEKSDVFSYAMLAYEIITENRSLSNFAQSVQSFDELREIKNMMPDITSIGDENIRNFIMKCFSPNPNDRPSFSDIITELEKDHFKEYMKVGEIDLEKYYLFKYKTSAEKGDPDAMNAYACLLEQGIRFRVSIDEIIRFYKSAIEKGSVKAMFNYGRMLYFGDGIPRDEQEGIKLWKMAVDNGNTYAMNNLAFLLYTGENIPEDKEKALIYYNMAALKGNFSAIHNLACIYRNGFKTQKDLKKAVDILNMGIELKDPESMCKCADIYRYGGVGLNADKKKAMELYQMAINEGNTDAMPSYADMLRDNEGGVCDKQKALDLYKRAMNKGNQYAKAQYNEMLKLGNDDKKDDTPTNITVYIIKFYDGVPIKRPEKVFYKKYT